MRLLKKSKQNKVSPSTGTISNEASKQEWNPYKNRILLAMYYESVESYRAIVSSTGIEGFCDMLIVNGSLNLAKWRAIGNVDDIMNKYYESQQKPKPFETSSIPAVLVEDSVGLTVCCKKNDITKRLGILDNVDLHSDFSLHGPVHVNTDRAIHNIDVSPTSRSRSWIYTAFDCKADVKHRFTEIIHWTYFQPGCNFEIPLNSGIHSCEKIACADRWHQMARKISVNIDGEADQHVLASPTKCRMHVQCFQALQQHVDELSTDDFEESNAQTSMYSHQLIDAYKPKGLLKCLQSILLHLCFCGIAVCPTLFFFIFWGVNTVNVYLIHPYWTPGFFFVIYALIFVAVAAAYLSLSYLDFPFLFYGKKGSYKMWTFLKLHYFIFSPFIGSL